ncbi:hypothetical protein JN403_11380 [Pseudomonas sp. 15A4]|uniref:GAP1-N1 domain-containing protein n=1 Tax=Pseudomonas sp. 15A4 TaxID=2804761 RepID=UPI0019674C3C|nr:hypothetical protein [Pseudomonas sp. 15A4]QSB21378.1 hypothetical protein JN403_11380 [Pseudomonas sp. 15A4]
MPTIEVSFPIRATYGETNQTHGILACSADKSLLPPILLDLTDKPPGYTSAGEGWGPSVGCGPIGQWWALWWTEPDPLASRAGMVLSQVAMWPLDTIGEAQELSKELEVLNGGKPIAFPSPLVVALVADALLANTSVPVFGNLQLWPGLLSMLWERLWPEARQAFSARVAISPSQGGESVAPPWLYGVDSGRLLEWGNNQVIIPSASETGTPSRAASWLIGQPDPFLKELLTSVTCLGSTLDTLRRTARVAEHLETLRTVPDAITAIYLLRALLNVSSDREELKAFKREAISVLVTNVPLASPSVIVSLANIASDQMPDGARLGEIVASWVAHVLPDTSITDADIFLTRLAAGTAQGWWLFAASTAIAEGLRSSNKKWSAFLVAWLSEKLHASFIATLGVITEATEQQLITVMLATKSSASQLSKLRQNANTLGWSGMHAIAVLQGDTVIEALQTQLEFLPDPSLGLSIMVDRIRGNDLINATVHIANPTLYSLVATRTAKDPGLLNNLDLGVPAWRALWELHVDFGGVPWPVGVDRYLQSQMYLAVAKIGNYRLGLISRLAEDFSQAAIDLEDRTNLWGRLDPADARTLAGAVARRLLQRSHALEGLAAPEPFLLQQVILQVPHCHLTAIQVACLLVWDRSLAETRAISLIRDIRDWSEGAQSLGKILVERRWRSVAKEIASLYRNKKRKYFQHSKFVLTF